MANAPAQAITDNVRALFGVGTCAGLTDGELLERFMAGRDDAGELAFEALVTRHGPMVMRICRNLLDDPHDAHDAFQAVFLVLARRAGAIRNRRSIGSWLYGVAMRVAARARLTAIRRQIRDRRMAQAAEAIATTVPRHDGSSPVERVDGAEIVHQEVNRLPEKYRAPIVLCYLEGLTHDEAASRLSWPVGTVRSRLARARDRLRTRLARRGMTAPAAIGPMASGITGDTLPPTVSGTSLFPGTVSRELSTSITRCASRLAVGRTTVATTAPTAVLSLVEGVLKSMLLKKVLIALCALLPLGMIAIGGGSLFARKSRAQDQRQPAATSPQDKATATQNGAPKTDDIDRLVQELVQAARARLEAQKVYYEEGRLTLDRFVDAVKQLELAELRIAKTDEDRLPIRQRFLDRLKEVEVREKAELVAGRGTVADAAEAVQQRLEAELDLKLRQKERDEMAKLIRRVSDLERKVEQLQKERAGK